jgi:hypothetical protein
MAIKKITDFSKPVAVGIDWHVLPGTTSQSKEVALLAKKYGAKVGAIVHDEVSGTTVLGICSDEPLGSPCGAAWLAKASNNESIVLIETLENGKLWLVAVRAGLPVQGLDMVIDHAELVEYLPRFVVDTQDVRICATVEGLEDLGYTNVFPQSFAELVGKTKQERLVRISGLSPLVVGAVAVVLIGGALYAGGGAYFDSLTKKQNEADAAEQARKTQQAQAQMQLKNAQQHRADGQAMLQQAVLGQPTVTAAVAAIMTAAEAMPTSVAGWTLASMDCSAKSCSYGWARTHLGTVVGFMQAADDHSWVLKTAAADHATTEQAIKTESRSATEESLSADAPFRAALESKLQEMQLAGASFDPLVPSTSIEAELPKRALDGTLLPPLAPGAGCLRECRR